MADDEGVDEGGGGGLMSGSRGWIIVISVVVLEAAFFSALLYFKSDKAPADTEIGEGLTGRKNLEEFMHLEHKMEKLTYSIPMPSGQPMTLAMDLVLVMEPTPREIREKISISQEDWAKFAEAVKKMDPLIRDALNRRINRMTSSELGTDRGQQMIREFVIESVNYQLQQLNLQLSNDKISKDRVREVLITNYYLN